MTMTIEADACSDDDDDSDDEFFVLKRRYRGMSQV